MNKSFMKKHILLNFLNMMIKDLPTPVNISYMWNFGSLLGMMLVIQFLSGFFLSMHYIADMNLAFLSIIDIMNNVNYGWIMRLMHMNGASMFFFFIYIHIGRGLYYHSYKMKEVWFVGIIILFMLMGIAFLGYVLPWGQMSFWGATVITNLISAIPYMGKMIVEWLWGGFSVGKSTLIRFYSIHFFLPFVLIFLILIHLIFLHMYSSNNPLGIKSMNYMIIFHNYFSIKDFLGMLFFLMLFYFLVIEYSYILGDSENFLEANSMITPLHIQPEWYFLFAYTILRSISNKLLGVIMLVMSICMLFLMPFILKTKFMSLYFYPVNQFNFWYFVNIMLMLTWLGMQVVEYPYVFISQIYMMKYFLYYFVDYLLKIFYDNM